jgi:hypothetical protein
MRVQTGMVSRLFLVYVDDCMDRFAFFLVPSEDGVNEAEGEPVDIE